MMNYLLKCVVRIHSRVRYISKRSHNNIVVIPLLAENRCDIHIKYTQSSKQTHFSFARPMDESVEAFVYRVTAKINVWIERKASRKKDTSLTRFLLEKVAFETEDGTVEPCCTLKKLLEYEGLHLMLGSEKMIVQKDAPWASAVTLPQSVIVGKQVLPRMKLASGCQADFDFVWKVSGDGGRTFKEVHRGHGFIPSKEHADWLLRVECDNAETDQQLNSMGMCRIVAARQCPEREKRFASMRNTLLGVNEFRVMTYNVLANYYADRASSRDDLFKHCPPEYLSMSNYRQSMLLHEILDSQSDVVCLQETDKELFREFLAPSMLQHGYRGCYTPRSSNEMEGLSVFWREEKFEVVQDLSQSKFNYTILQDSRFSSLSRHIRSQDDLLKFWLNINHAFAAHTLQLRSNPTHCITIVTVHLCFHPGACKVRQLQLASILQYLHHHRVANMQSQSRAPIMLLGDFNSPTHTFPIQYVLNCPNLSIPDLSTCIELQNQSELQVELCQSIESQEEANIEAQFKAPEFRHDLNFVKPVSYEFTNFTPQFQAELDHVVYESPSYMSEGGLEFMRDFGLPSRQYMEGGGGLPNEFWPSDHLALVMDFKFLTNKSKCLS